MSTNTEGDNSADILPIRDPPRVMAVSEELGRLTGILSEICPREAVITFEYDGALRLHVDVRHSEDVSAVEALLPSICGGIFHDTQRGLAPRRSFFHRLSSIVSL